MDENTALYRSLRDRGVSEDQSKNITFSLSKVTYKIAPFEPNPILAGLNLMAADMGVYMAREYPRFLSDDPQDHHWHVMSSGKALYVSKDEWTYLSVHSEDELDKDPDIKEYSREDIEKARNRKYPYYLSDGHPETGYWKVNGPEDIEIIGSDGIVHKSVNSKETLKGNPDIGEVSWEWIRSRLETEYPRYFINSHLPGRYWYVSDGEVRIRANCHDHLSHYSEEELERKVQDPDDSFKEVSRDEAIDHYHKSGVEQEPEKCRKLEKEDIRPGMFVTPDAERNRDKSYHDKILYVIDVAVPLVKARFLEPRFGRDDDVETLSTDTFDFLQVPESFVDEDKKQQVKQ